MKINEIYGNPIKWWYLRDENQTLDWKCNCPFFQSYLELTETPAERKFLELYINKHLQYNIQNMSDSIVSEGSYFMDGIKDFIPDILNSEPNNRVPGDKGWGRKRLGVPLTVALIAPETYDRSNILIPASEISLMFKQYAEELAHISKKGIKVNIATASNLNETEVFQLGAWLRNSLYQIDALIPQVWLRHIYDSKQNPKTDHLKEEAYSRVDFILLWNGKRVVFEIDGPEHYAEWQKDKQDWKVSEEKYIQNLKRERRLKSEGWHLFRLGNQEVETASSWVDIESLLSIEKYLDVDMSTPDYPQKYYFY